MNIRAARGASCTFAIAAGIVVVLHRLGDAHAMPSLREWDQLASWIDSHGTVGASMAMLRLGAMSAASYLAVVAAASVVVALRPSVRFRTTLTRLTPATLRRVLGLGTIAALSVTTFTARPVHADDPPVLVQVDTTTLLTTTLPTTTPSPTTSTTTLSPATTVPPAPPTLVRTGATPDTTTPDTTTPETSATEQRTETWTVQRGQHLWGIAAATVRARGGGDHEIASYWRTLVDANLDRLVVPGAPDLIFPGQVLVLPPAQAPTR